MRQNPNAARERIMKALRPAYMPQLPPAQASPATSPATVTAAGGSGRGQRGGVGAEESNLNQWIKSPLLYQLSYAPSFRFSVSSSASRARRESNPQPSASKADALSS